MKKICVIILVLILFVFTPTIVKSNDDMNNDPVWSQSGHDERNTGLSQYNTSKVDGTLKWKHNFSQPFNSPPIIDSRGNIYLTTMGGYEGGMYEYYGKSKLIRLNKEGQIEVNHTIGYIYQETIAIDDDIIYFVSKGKNGGYNLTALNEDMDVKWKYPMDGPIFKKLTIGPHGSIYFSYNTTFYSINKNGNLNWRWDGREYSFLLNEEQNIPPMSAPAVDENGNVYFNFNGNLICVDENGTSKWYNLVGIGLSRPMIDKIGNIYLVFYKPENNYLLSFHKNGSYKWRVPVNSTILSPPSLGPDGTIYVTVSTIYQGSDYLLAIDKEGKKKWRFNTASYLWMTKAPVIGNDGTIYFGAHARNSEENKPDIIYAVNPDGSEKWSYNTYSGEEFSQSIGPDGTVYFVSGSTIYAFGPKTSDDENTPSLISPVFFATIVSLAIIYELRKTKKQR